MKQNSYLILMLVVRQVLLGVDRKVIWSTPQILFKSSRQLPDCHLANCLFPPQTSCGIKVWRLARIIQTTHLFKSAVPQHFFRHYLYPFNGCSFPTVYKKVRFLFSHAINGIKRLQKRRQRKLPWITVFSVLSVSLLVWDVAAAPDKSMCDEQGKEDTCRSGMWVWETEGMSMLTIVFIYLCA